MASPINFDFERDLQRSIPDQVKLAIADVVIAWAQLDVGLTQWFGKAFGMQPFEASLAIGRMDNKTKLDRLKRLHEQRGQPRLAKRAAAISKSIKDHVDLRNTIAHNACIGVRVADSSVAVYMTQQPDGADGHKQIAFVSVAQMGLVTAVGAELKAKLFPVLMVFERGLKDMADD